MRVSVARRMMILSDLERFRIWMSENTSLSPSSIRHYSQAVGTINKEMMEAGIISYSLADTSPLRVEIAIDRIMRSAAFIAKNTKGNNMYSNGLKQYRLFRISDYVCSQQELEQCIDAFPVKDITEREALVKARIGQGLFKKQLKKNMVRSVLLRE